MEIQHIETAYFSPTGNVRRAMEWLTQAVATRLGRKPTYWDCTLPAARHMVHTYQPGDLLLVGTPVYAGRIPNKLLPFWQSSFGGNGAAVVLVCLYGNRSFGDALTELRDTFQAAHFAPLAAAALPSEHAFVPELATGRPNDTDRAELVAFAEQLVAKLTTWEPLSDCPSSTSPASSISSTSPAPAATSTPPTSPAPSATSTSPASPSATLLEVPGNSPAGAYYTPLRQDGQPAVFLKAKPQTDAARCTRCGLCASVCPMGSIDPQDVTQVPGLCIKCQACVTHCPQGAKFFDQADFLSHRAMLREHYTAHRDNAFFL